MVHCNNGASELDAWVRLFAAFAAAAGTRLDEDAAFATCLDAALGGESDGGGLLAYNYLAGEPVTGLPEGRPLVARTPSSRHTLANFMRTQVYSVFATLSLGMRTLTREGVRVESMLAHGGLFRTAGVAQRFLAAALDTPVAVRPTAGQGGAWGCAILADYMRTGAQISLRDHLQHVFSGEAMDTVAPDAADRADRRQCSELSKTTNLYERRSMFLPDDVRSTVESLRAQVADLHSELTRWGLVGVDRPRSSRRAARPGRRR